MIISHLYKNSNQDRAYYTQFRLRTLFSLYAIGISLVLIPGFFTVSSIRDGEQIDVILGFLAMLIFELALALYCINKIQRKEYKIIREGVKKKCRNKDDIVKWEEIEFIGFYYYPKWVPLKIIIISTYWNKDILRQRLWGMKKTLGNTVFLEYRPQILEEIKKYWDDEIIYENRYCKTKTQL